MITAKILADSISRANCRVTTFELEYPRYIHSELMTHRCVAGDTKLFFDLPAGAKRSNKRVYTMTIKEFCSKWNKGVKAHVCGRVDKNIKVDNVIPSKYYTPKELANELGYKSVSNIRQYCRQGRLPYTSNNSNSKSEKFLILGQDFLNFRKTFGMKTFTIKERLKAMKIRCLNTKTKFIEHTNITDCWEVGEEEVFEIITKSGNKIRATKDHPFYNGKSYVEVQDLKIGDYIYIQAMGKEFTRDVNKFNKINGQWVQTWIKQNKNIVANNYNGKCALCGNPLPESFDLHHIVPRHIDPSKAFDINNVEPLCPNCHKQKHLNQKTYNSGGAYLYAKPDEIISIESKGVETVYDLSVANEEHNFIANGFVVHNCFSRNCASSRAIPINTQIQLCLDNPVKPEFTLNQVGMQGKEADKETKKEAQRIWDLACSQAIIFAKELADLGIHKQNANRLLEPFQHMKTVLTGSDFDNFFNLRIDEAAQPEIYTLACKMKDLMEFSSPKVLDPEEWHTPYVTGVMDPEEAKKTSVACCAQVSYRKCDTSEEKVQSIFNRLINSGKLHASPFEHVCRPNYPGEKQRGNLRGWHQFRADIEDLI